MTLRVPLDRIVDSPFQTREHYDLGRIAELAESIERDDLIQVPPARVVNSNGRLVEPSATPFSPGYLYDRKGGASWITSCLGSGDRIQLAVGHTRLRAFRRLERDAMPVDLRPLTDRQMDMLAWSENHHRGALSSVEEARAIEARITRYGWTQEEAGAELGLARSTISNKLRLLLLPDDVLAHLTAGRITERQAMALVPMYQAEGEYSEDLRGTILGGPEFIVDEALTGASSSRLRQLVASYVTALEHRRRDDARAEQQAETRTEQQAEALADGADGSDDVWAELSAKERRLFARAILDMREKQSEIYFLSEGEGDFDVATSLMKRGLVYALGQTINITRAGGDVAIAHEAELEALAGDGTDPDTERAQAERAAGRHAFSEAEVAAAAEPTEEVATTPAPALRIVLVACGKQKAAAPTAASKLYTGPLFQKAAAYAEALVSGGEADGWFILSAKHGAVTPHQVIKPYDEAMQQKMNDERQDWAGRVQRTLESFKRFGQHLSFERDHFILLAGEDYRRPIVDRMASWEAPMEGLGIGEQMAWLAAQVEVKTALEALTRETSATDEPQPEAGEAEAPDGLVPYSYGGGVEKKWGTKTVYVKPLETRKAHGRLYHLVRSVVHVRDDGSLAEGTQYGVVRDDGLLVACTWVTPKQAWARLAANGTIRTGGLTEEDLNARPSFGGDTADEMIADGRIKPPPKPVPKRPPHAERIKLDEQPGDGVKASRAEEDTSRAVSRDEALQDITERVFEIVGQETGSALLRLLCYVGGPRLREQPPATMGDAVQVVTEALAETCLRIAEAEDAGTGFGDYRVPRARVLDWLSEPFPLKAPKKKRTAVAA